MIKVCFWNIGRALDKLDNAIMLNKFMHYDIIFLAELKTDGDLYVPGFKYKRCPPKERYVNRGGLCAFIKDSLMPLVKDCLFDGDDAIWINMEPLNKLVVAGMYIPPSDSPYYTDDLFATVQMRLRSTFSGRNVLFGGDLNSRLGDYQSLPSFDLPQVSYQPSEDLNRNQSGHMLRGLINDNQLFILNNMKLGDKTFRVGLTFARRGDMISELDVALCTRGLLGNVVSFGRADLPPHFSDHVGIEVNLNCTIAPDMKDIKHRCSLLGESECNTAAPVKRPVPLNALNSQVFIEQLRGFDPSVMLIPDDVTISSQRITDILYQVAQEHSRAHANEDENRPHNTTELSRWQSFIEENDPKTLWRAIGWSGKLCDGPNNPPSEDQFKDHFERLLHDPDASVDDIDTIECPNIPVLDSPVTLLEYERAVHSLKPSKAAGRDGVSPGILKILPDNWIAVLLTLFNIILRTSNMPLHWAYSRLVTVYKKGPHEVCSNYRGIAVTDAIAKLFDLILNNRLKQWYRPLPQQAGAQSGRGCIEQILALRMIIAYAKSKKTKLWITFVDFRQAYDRVPRTKLLEELKNAGCGGSFLRALMAIYRSTKFILKQAVIEASKGVKQGAPLSCLLFCFYLDAMVRRICSFGSDGYLGNLHCLLLMDDTAVLATSRRACEEKLDRLLQYCAEFGMSINESKTEFMVINGDQDDQRDLEIQGATIKHCSSYWYLGTPITSDGSMKSVINIHVKDKMKHVLKFVTFLKKQHNMPFTVKRKVAEACVTSAIIYGAETWLCDNFRPLEVLYGKVIRSLLGVRHSTPLELCLVEADMPPLNDLIIGRRKSFMEKFLHRESTDSPLHDALAVTREVSSAGLRAFRSYDDYTNVNLAGIIAQKAMQHSRFAVYMDLNPSLTQPDVYRSNAKDSLRIAYSRMRLSSHRLRIETGRWNRPPTPRELRVCPCGGGVQDEQHVLCECSLSNHLRVRFHVNVRRNFLSTCDREELLYIAEVLALYH